MTLSLENQNNVFYAKGMIDEYNSEVLKRYILLQFQKNSNVTIDISGVFKIDKYGMRVLTSLYRNSLEKDKKFRIVGYGCKEIYDEFLASA
ncbi:MAG: STAS domain-containing protein [Flavobacteriaceae bacterium]